jgi:hypothetical protein
MKEELMAGSNSFRTGSSQKEMKQISINKNTWWRFPATQPSFSDTIPENSQTMKFFGKYFVQQPGGCCDNGITTAKSG